MSRDLSRRSAGSSLIKKALTMSRRVMLVIAPPVSSSGGSFRILMIASWEELDMPRRNDSRG